jgi:hypothetical protein
LTDFFDRSAKSLDHGPFLFGDPDEYAHGKAREFPDEGGPVILVLQVPDEVVQKAVTDWFALSQGLCSLIPVRGLKNWWLLDRESRVLH